MKVSSIVFFFFFFGGASVNFYSQDSLEIKKISASYSDYCTHKDSVIKKITLCNHTDDDYITWISSLPVERHSNKDLVHNYFKKRKGDFSLMFMMYEQMYEQMLEQIGFKLGVSFLKKITPNKCFSYVLTQINDSNFKFYNDRIVILRKEELEEYLHITIDEKYYFPSDSIVISALSSDYSCSSVSEEK